MKKSKRLGYETKHCMWFMDWIRAHSHHPSRRELKLLFHITNEGKRTKAAAGIAKAMGMLKGVWDYFLPVPVKGISTSFVMSCGLWIEMKKPKEKLTPEQEWFGEAMRQQGYTTKVCYSWPEAVAAVCEYLRIPHAP